MDELVLCNSVYTVRRLSKGVSRLRFLTVRRSRWRPYVSAERRLTFNGLHGIVSQKTAFFIITVVRTSKKTKLHGLSPRKNYTDRAIAACRLSDCQLVRMEGATWSAWLIPPAVFYRFSRQEPLLFYQVAPQLYSRDWVDPVPDPLFFFFLVVPGIEPRPPDL
jgi:hypothetical protein